MSARPDLTTEELIRWCEDQATWAEGHAARERHAAIAQRLRSERPAVTPEERKCVVCGQPVTELESFKFLAFDGYYHQGCDFIVEIPEQSTEGKP